MIGSLRETILPGVTESIKLFQVIDVVFFFFCVNKIRCHILHYVASTANFWTEVFSDEYSVVFY